MCAEVHFINHIQSTPGWSRIFKQSIIHNATHNKPIRWHGEVETFGSAQRMLCCLRTWNTSANIQRFVESRTGTPVVSLDPLVPHIRIRESWNDVCVVMNTGVYMYSDLITLSCVCDVTFYFSNACSINKRIFLSPTSTNKIRKTLHVKY